MSQTIKGRIAIARESTVIRPGCYYIETPDSQLVLTHAGEWSEPDRDTDSHYWPSEWAALEAIDRYSEESP